MSDEVAILVSAAAAIAFAVASVFCRFESPEHYYNYNYGNKKQNWDGGYDDNKHGIGGENAMVMGIRLWMRVMVNMGMVVCRWACRSSSGVGFHEHKEQWTEKKLLERERDKVNDRDEMVDVKMYRELVFPLGLENMKISVRIMVAEFPFLGGHAASLRLPYLSLPNFLSNQT